MVAHAASGSGTGDEGVDELRARCERGLGLLRELARIHLEIDAPTRRIGMDEPDWICRMRKLCLHVRAITGWELGADVEHVMATELRAAYVQMGSVWKRVPEKFRLEKLGGGPWADEARNGMLATYDHPTPQSLLLSAGRGGFGSGEDQQSYAQLFVWLCGFGLGYGLALAYLAEVLGAERGIVSRVATALQDFNRAVVTVHTGYHRPDPCGNTR